MVKLEYFTPNDFQSLVKWISDEDLLVNWAGSHFHFPLTEGKLVSYLKEANDFAESSTLIYKALNTETNEVVGHASLTAINRSNRSARITRVLVGNSSDRGKGTGEQIIKALMQIGFGEIDLHRISLGVYTFNEAGIRCYKKCGFKTDGVLRDIKKRGDSFWSMVEMSILEDEWRAFEGALTI